MQFNSWKGQYDSENDNVLYILIDLKKTFLILNAEIVALIFVIVIFMYFMHIGWLGDGGSLFSSWISF